MPANLTMEAWLTAGAEFLTALAPFAVLCLGFYLGIYLIEKMLGWAKSLSSRKN